MDSSGIPTDGPETVLGQVARRLKLRYSRTFVARKVASHPQPSSLLALVEVANGLGIKTTPGKADADALNDLDGPTVVHFSGVEGGGFGVLEEVSDDAVKVWDSINGLHPIDRKTFLTHWSGVIVLVDRADGDRPGEPGYLKNRTAEVIFSGYEPPAIVGNRSAQLLRALLVILAAVVLTLAVVAVPTDKRPAAIVLTFLTIIGLLVTVLTGVSIGAQDSALSDRICARGKFVDCHSVLSSRYSRIFGIPLSDIGIAIFGSLLLLIGTGAIAYRESVWATIETHYISSVPFSLLLIGVQIGIRQLCTLCIGVHAVNLSAAAVAWLWLDPDWSLGGVLRTASFLALLFFILLFLAIPYFKKHQGLRVLAGMHRRISSSPFASLAELLTEPPVDIQPAEFAIALNDNAEAHDLVVFVNPTCNKCDPALQQVKALAERGSVRVHVGLAPKDPDEDERALCSSILAVGSALGPEAMLLAYPTAKARLRSMMEGDPVQVLADAMELPRDRLEAVLADARQRALNAEVLVDAHAEGTPAVFFDGRLYRGELTHLAYLLERHRDLLEPTLGAPS